MHTKLFLAFLLSCLFTHVFSQTDLPPLERALSGIVTVGVYEVAEDDQVMGFATGRKTYAEIAYEQNLNMGEAFSNGSGFVVELDGKYYILTNAHVIDAASRESGAIAVFSISRDKYPVKLVGGDSFYDFAVLEFDGVAPGPEIEPLQFSESQVALAQRIYAIGNPLGKYPYSVTEGIISGKNRLYHRPTTGRYGFLQHTATLIWGNSGGPLVDENGKVVGINTWIETRNKNGQNYLFSQLNFALEGQKALQLAKAIIGNGGRLKRAFLGVEFAVVSGSDVPDGPPFIKSVLEDSPASEALKSRVGYTVTAINGQAVQTLQDIVRIMEEATPGSQITLGLKKAMAGAEESVPAGDLSTDRLEEVARHFFKQYSDYQIADDAKGVSLSGKADKNSLRLEQFQAAGEGDNWATFAVVEGKAEYGLAGLGGLEKQGQLGAYQVQNVQQLGAVIRLCSLEGHLGATLVENGEYAGTVRFYMQDGDFNEIKVLYY